MVGRNPVRDEENDEATPNPDPTEIDDGTDDAEEDGDIDTTDDDDDDDDDEVVVDPDLPTDPEHQPAP